MLLFRLVMAGLCLLCVAPILSVIASSAIADAYGCRLNEAGPNPCLVGGTDIGETLSFMFVSGWFALLTLPMLLGLAVLWLVVELVAGRRPR